MKLGSVLLSGFLYCCVTSLGDAHGHGNQKGQAVERKQPKTPALRRTSKSAPRRQLFNQFGSTLLEALLQIPARGVEIAQTGTQILAGLDPMQRIAPPPLTGSAYGFSGVDNIVDQTRDLAEISGNFMKHFGDRVKNIATKTASRFEGIADASLGLTGSSFGAARDLQDAGKIVTQTATGLASDAVETTTKMLATVAHELTKLVGNPALGLLAAAGGPGYDVV